MQRLAGSGPTAAREEQVSYTRGSVILWRGPSAIDGRPIVVVATGVPSRKGVLRGANAKTGRMTQVWILLDGWVDELDRDHHREAVRVRLVRHPGVPPSDERARKKKGGLSGADAVRVTHD